MQEVPVSNPQLPPVSSKQIPLWLPPAHPNDALAFLYVQGRGEQGTARRQVLIITGDALPAPSHRTGASCPPRCLLTSSAATSCLLRRMRKAKGCLGPSPGTTSQPRRTMAFTWVRRSVRSLWK